MNYELVLAICLVSVWFAGIVCEQAVAIYESATGRNVAHRAWWTKFDIFGLFPRFSFFSWLPVWHYHLLYRDQSIEGGISPWNLVALPARPPMTKFIWNPGRRKRFALEDMCRSLLWHMKAELLNADHPSPFCFAYVALACYVAQIPCCPLSSARQFMIAQTRAKEADRAPEVLFISPLFSLLAVS
jgi:hypothetical protein